MSGKAQPDEVRMRIFNQTPFEPEADAAAGIEWRPIEGQPAYYVSSDGRVRHGTCILSGADGPRGYRQVHTRNGMFKVHQLVASAFLGPRPEGYDIRHLNDEKADNRIENLCYGTRRENMLDRTRNGRCPAALKTHCARGHEFTEDNIYWQRGRHRACRRCRLEDKRRRDMEAREAAVEAGLKPRLGFCQKNLHDLTQPGATIQHGPSRLCRECRAQYRIEHPRKSRAAS